MDVWIDVHTPKQALFFWPLTTRMKRGGMRVLVTSRRYEQSTWILRYLGLDVLTIGRFGGGSLLGKLKASSSRQNMLIRVIERDVPKLAISSGSPECCRICFGLGIKHILASDSPHSPVNKMCVPLSELVLSPFVISKSSWTIYGCRREQVRRYKSLDPVAWMRRLRIDDGLVRRLGLREGFILIRTPESKASYLSGRGVEEGIYMIRNALKVTDGEVVVLPRYSDERAVLRRRFPSRVRILERPVMALPLIKAASIVLCGGGTMAQESALLGKPTIMCYPGSLPEVHRFLVRKGLLTHLSLKSFSELPRILRALQREDRSDEARRRAELLMSRMEDPVEFIYRQIKELL